MLAVDAPPSITNVADATSAGSAICAPGGTPPPCAAAVLVTVTPAGGIEPVPTPIDARWMLLLVAMVLAGAAVRMQRRI